MRSHRYIPAVDETVIGIVSEVHAENYNLDISAPVKAVLPVLSFEGATKHNRPKLAVGSLVHCRVLKTSSTAEPLLTCVDKQGRAGGLGVLTGGYTYQCSTHAAQRLLSSAGGKALEKLGESVAFELVVGFNDRMLDRRGHRRGPDRRRQDARGRRRVIRAGVVAGRDDVSPLARPYGCKTTYSYTASATPVKRATFFIQRPRERNLTPQPSPRAHPARDRLRIRELPAHVLARERAEPPA